MLVFEQRLEQPDLNGCLVKHPPIFPWYEIWFIQLTQPFCRRLRYQAILKSSDATPSSCTSTAGSINSRPETNSPGGSSRDLLVPFGGHQQPLKRSRFHHPNKVWTLRKSTHLFAESVGVLHLFSSDPEINNPVFFFKVYQTYDMSLTKSWHPTNFLRISCHWPPRGISIKSIRVGGSLKPVAFTLHRTMFWWGAILGINKNPNFNSFFLSVCWFFDIFCGVCVLMFLWCFFLKKVHLQKRTTLRFGFLKEDLGVSKTRGTPKWMVYTGKPY